MGDVASGQVLVVSADERWLRVLEVTLRLAGVETISRRSAQDGLNVARGDSEVSAIVLDLAQATGDELDVARHLLGENSLPAVVILPEPMAAQSEPFAAVGATVLVRPYRPSELYAALQITDDDGSPILEPMAPLSVESAPGTTPDTPPEADEA